MAQLALPANSRITAGKTWPRPANAKRITEFRIYRWNPDDDANPRMDAYFVDRDDCGPMILDALIWIKSKIELDTRPSAAPAARACAGRAR